jgi:hypothetical protein
MENVCIFYDHSEYLRPLGIIYGRLGLLVVIWYIFPILLCLDQEKSGNPGFKPGRFRHKQKRCRPLASAERNLASQFSEIFFRR